MDLAHQAPLSMGLSRQENCGGLPFPSPGDIPHPGIEPVSLVSPALAGGFFTTSTTWEGHSDVVFLINLILPRSLFNGFFYVEFLPLSPSLIFFLVNPC